MKQNNKPIKQPRVKDWENKLTSDSDVIKKNHMSNYNTENVNWDFNEYTEEMLLGKTKSEDIKNRRIITTWINRQRQLGVNLLKQQRELDRAEIIDEIEEYFGHILNDGLTGKPMKISIEEVSKDIVKILKKGE